MIDDKICQRASQVVYLHIPARIGLGKLTNNTGLIGGAVQVDSGSISLMELAKIILEVPVKQFFGFVALQCDGKQGVPLSCTS